MAHRTQVLAPGLLFAFCLAFDAGAATYPVTVFTDTAATAGGSAAGAGDGPGVSGDLRHTILMANAVGGTNSITFVCASPPCKITLGGPLPPIASNLTIDGETAGNIVIDGNSAYRVFFVDSGTVTLTSLQIQNARAQGGTGGVGYATAGGGGLGAGAGLFVNQSSAVVRLANVYFLNTVARGGDGGAGIAAAQAGGGGGGGGGMPFAGAAGASPSADVNGIGGGGGGGGTLGPGAASTGTPGGIGGSGGGGNGGDADGGGGANGGFGGGGGGGGNASQGGNGGFGGGGGGVGSDNVPGGSGGPGGGGGAGGSIGPGGLLTTAVHGGDGAISSLSILPAGGGGGAAAGPAIFVNAGSVTILNSTQSGSSATPGAGGAALGGTAGDPGVSDATPVFNYSGSVNSSATKGPIPGALPGGLPATHFSVVAGTPAQVFTQDPITITALDQFGNPTTGYNGLVDFTSTDPGFVASSGQGLSLTNGAGTFNFAFKTAGTQTLTATDSVTASITGTSNSITVNPGATARFVVSAPATAIPGVSFSFTVTAVDLNNNATPAYGGTVSFTSTDGAAALPGSSTLINGVGTLSAVLNTKGNQTITASDVPNSLTGTSGTIAVSASPPALSAAFSPASVAVGGSGTTTLTVTVTNPNAAAGLTGIAFSDTYPAGLVRDSIGTANCGGSESFSLSGFTISGVSLAAGASCITQSHMHATSTGSIVDITSTVTSNQSSAGPAATATLTVAAPPSLMVTFGATTITVGESTSLTFTVTNTDVVNAITGVAFTDTLPPGMTLLSPDLAQLMDSCGNGTITWTAGGDSISLTGATLPAGATCGFGMSVAFNLVGSFTNTTGAVSSTNGGVGNIASANLTVLPLPPAISQVFGAASIPLNGSTSLSFTIANSNLATALTGVAFTDALPAGLTVTSPGNGLAGSCGGGTIAATAGGGSVSLTGATLTANASCTFSVNVTAGSAGYYANTIVSVSSTNGGSEGGATASLTALSPPIIAKSFGAASIPVNGTTSLTFSLTNLSTTAQLTGVAFTDTLPANMTVAAPNGLSGSCGGGTIAATAAGNSVSLSGATISVAHLVLPGFPPVPGGSCTFSVNVTVTAPGNYANTTNAVTSTNGGAGNTASASLSTLAPPSISKAFGAPTIPLAGSTSLTFAVGNPNGTSSLTGVAFTDTLPAGMTVSTPNGLTGACGGGTITATAAGGSVSLAGATLAASASCIFSVSVTASAGGTYSNVTGAVSSTNGGTGNMASASLSTLIPVTFQTSPAGLNVTIDSVASASPVTIGFLPGSAHIVAVSSPQAGGPGTQYVFANWSDSGAASHSISGPLSPATYTASFTTQYLLTTSASGGAVTPATGFFNAGSTVSVLALANAGSHFSNWVGPVTVTSSGAGTVLMNQPQTVTAVFTPNSNATVSPSSLSLVDYIGGNGASVLSGSFTVTTSDNRGFTLSGSAPWLNVSVAGNQVNVSVNTQAVISAFFAAVNLTFTFGDGSTQVAQVTLQAISQPQFALPVGTTALTFSAAAGSASPLTQTITVSAGGSNIPAQATAATSSGGNWLSVTGGGTTPQTLTVQVNPTGLGPGTYQGIITITSTGAGTNALAIPVTLTIAPSAIAIRGLDNAGSLQTTAAAPNTIFSVFGTFPGCTAGAQVTVDGSPTTVFYSSPSQINFLIPAAIAGEASTALAITCAELSTGPLTLPVAAIAPSLFTVTQSGTGQADSVNQDNSIDAPVPDGTAIQLYGTGFGLYAPVSADGLTRLVQTVSATVGGVPAQVLFAGQAPGYTTGLQQIDILVPVNAPKGTGILLVLTIDGATTQTGLTLTVQ
jgi:uncharacterized repeat protein (TIGR01451 family)